MQKITAFKTSDGQTFENELQALQHEMLISVRGVINSDEMIGTSSDRLTTTQVAQIVIRNEKELIEIIRKFQQKIRGFGQRKLRPVI
jgi:hypothetical protein